MKDFFQRLQDPEEGPFLIKLSNHAADPQVRADYAAWLQGRGDARAEAVVIANQLLAGVADSAERKQLVARLLEVRHRLDQTLAALLLTPITVRNCGEKTGQDPVLRFTFRCQQNWSEMQPTDDAAVRFCEQCATAVIRCHSVDEAERQARLGACISFDSGVIAEVNQRYGGHHTGRVDVFAMWADRLF